MSTFTLAPVRPTQDAEAVHAWLTSPHARYWEMQDHTLEQVREHLQTVAAHPAQNGWIGRRRTAADTGDAGAPLFYVETYRPSLLIPAHELPEQPGDLGMHLLIAPPGETPVHGVTAAVMRDVVAFCLGDPGADGTAGLDALRLVVEPDARNTAILAKNAAAGFRVLREIDLVADGHTKRAALSVCTREDFAASPLGQGRSGERAPHAHLSRGTAARAHRHLVAKALSEFAHERLIAPRADAASAQADAATQVDALMQADARRPGDDPAPSAATPAPTQPMQATGADPAVERRWLLELGETVYTFRARVLPLEHWLVEEASIVRRVNDLPQPLDAQQLILDLQESLGIPEDLLSTYLEELASTFATGAAKLDDAQEGRRPTSGELVGADLQTVEAAMTEGHPGFLANNGRIGYSLSDYRAYAPETGSRTRLFWVAARRSLSHLAVGHGLDEQEHLHQALSTEELDAFTDRLACRGLDPSDYHLLPLHPWQAEHRLPITFAADIARDDLVPLGPGGDEFQAQQSLRTFFNRTRPGAPYVKVALAIQNMGFLRGLSPHYMRDTPAINDWVAALVAEDPTFADAGFSVLRERAALGYTGDAYHRTTGTNPHRKMLAALWRENPVPLLEDGEQALTMAALLHRDHEGTALVTELIRASGLSPQEWLDRYLSAYLYPLVHALLAHDVVFMPHGENLILRVRDHVVTGAFMKDIGEETAVLGERPLPVGVARIRALGADGAPLPGHEKALSVFTDMFDGVLRHLSGILDADGMLPATEFWDLVAAVLDRYESDHPATAKGLAGDVDLRARTFSHSCLNRLQLRNTLQMVDIGDQSASLLHAGRMDNPVALARDAAEVPADGAEGATGGTAEGAEEATGGTADGAEGATGGAAGSRDGATGPLEAGPDRAIATSGV
ncbi:GNAT family N-acetyltransferase [Brachybacterium alimentarium]|uniref:GNAT family N-acetyltransferase n=1 Tax=Brachybacterium alimentarium TaxID=47845 RepID=UPI003FD5B202